MAQQHKSVFDAGGTYLEKFGETLKPTKSFREDGKRLAQNVFLKLQECLPKEFTLAEPRFAGSFGKSTDVIQSDLDLCAVVNKRLPPFDNEGGVLDKMEDILDQYQDELQIQEGSIKGKSKKTAGKPRVSIQFMFKNEMEVDLLPAANLEQDSVLAEIGKDPDKNFYIYNSSLASAQLAFMKSQSSFTHTLIRIAKFWLKSLSFGDKKFFGGSTLMELLGCAAAEEERSISKPSMLHAFVRVLQMVCDIDTIKLVFEPVSSPRHPIRWQRIPVSELKARGTALVPKIVGTKAILQRKCFIVDPANPFFDQLANKDPALIQIIKEFAVQTKYRVAKFMDKMLKTINTVPFDCIQVFEPQPAHLKSQYPALLFPNDFCLGYAFPYAPPCFASAIIRRKDIYEEKKTRLVIETLMWDLLAVVHSTLYTYPGTTTVGNIQSSVDSLIEMCFDIKQIPPGGHQDRHDTMDVTLCIPYLLKDNISAVKFSMSWTKAGMLNEFLGVGKAGL